MDFTRDRILQVAWPHVRNTFYEILFVYFVICQNYRRGYNENTARGCEVQTAGRQVRWYLWRLDQTTTGRSKPICWDVQACVVFQVSCNFLVNKLKHASSCYFTIVWSVLCETILKQLKNKIPVVQSYETSFKAGRLQRKAATYPGFFKKGFGSMTFPMTVKTLYYWTTN